MFGDGLTRIQFASLLQRNLVSTNAFENVYTVLRVDAFTSINGHTVLYMVSSAAILKWWQRTTDCYDVQIRYVPRATSDRVSTLLISACSKWYVMYAQLQSRERNCDAKVQRRISLILGLLVWKYWKQPQYNLAWVTGQLSEIAAFVTICIHVFSNLKLFEQIKMMFPPSSSVTSFENYNLWENQSKMPSWQQLEALWEYELFLFVRLPCLNAQHTRAEAKEAAKGRRSPTTGRGWRRCSGCLSTTCACRPNAPLSCPRR